MRCALRLELGLQLCLGLAALARRSAPGPTSMSCEGRREVRQHERVGVVRVEEVAALLGQVGLVALLVDGEEQLLLQLEELALAACPGKTTARPCRAACGDSPGPPAARSSRLLLRLAQLHLEEQQAGRRRRFARRRSAFLASRRPAGCTAGSALRTSCSTSGLKRSNWCVETVAGPLMMSGVRASSIRIESTSSTMAKIMAALDLLLLARWPCRCRAGSRSRTRCSCRR